MRITLKKEEGASRVHINGKQTPLLIAFDRTTKEWDLCTEQEHILAAYSRGAVLRRLEVVAKALIGDEG